MPEIFGVDEKIWFRALREVLKTLEIKQLEIKQKERVDGEPRPIMSAPAKVLSVEHTFDRLEILAYLDGEPVERVNLRIGIR
jgi:hypothetical protein